MRLIACCILALLATHVHAADRVGDGVESEVRATEAAALPLPLPDETVRQPVAPPVEPIHADVSTEEKTGDILVPRTGDVSPLPSTGPLTQAASVPIRSNSVPVPPTTDLKPLPDPENTGLEPVAIDRAGDRPGTVAANQTSPFHVEMEDFTLAGTPSPKAQKTIEIVTELKKLIGQIARDLDAGGMERTRLVFNTESLAKQISVMAELWNQVPPLVSSCINAKRSSFVLEEELRNEPRRWTHVRWAFQDCQRDVKSLRRLAARLANVEPQLVRVERKGKVYYEEPAKSPEETQQELESQRVQDLKDERDRNREREKDIKNSKDKVPLQYGM